MQFRMRHPHPLTAPVVTAISQRHAWASRPDAIVRADTDDLARVHRFDLTQDSIDLWR
jgi:hypothetical protein